MIKNVGSVLLVSAWLGLMGLAGYILSYPLSHFLGVKHVEVENAGFLPFSAIRFALEGYDLLSLEADEVEDILRERFGDRIKSVKVRRRYTFSGAILKIEVEERTPVARLKLGKGYLLIDSEGYTFRPMGDEGKNLPYVATYDKELLFKNFTRLYDEVLSLGLPVKEVRVKPRGVLVVLNTTKLILPPLEDLPDNLSARVKMVYNLFKNGSKVDLRYSKFILVR